MSDEHTIIRKLDDIAREVQTIKRGVYGDEDNEVPGLIDHAKDHNKRIKSLEDTKKQALWWGGGVLLTLNAMWHFLKERL